MQNEYTGVGQRMADGDHFIALLQASKSYGKKLGVSKDLFIDLFRETSDWAFIIQIDALNETASRETLSRLLAVIGVEADGNDTPADFVQSLNYQGRTSIIRLLKLAGVTKEMTEFVEFVRMVRNSYAHDIRSLNKPLLEIILARSEKSKILRRFSLVEQDAYDEAELMRVVEDDGGLLRFLILQQCMTFLLGMHQTYGRRGKRS